VKESECPHHQAGLPSIPCVQVGPEQPSLSLQVCAVRILQAQSLPGLQRLFLSFTRFFSMPKECEAVSGCHPGNT
jgi:hypothetical protein